MLADQSAGPVLTSGFPSGVEYYDNIQSGAGVSSPIPAWMPSNNDYARISRRKTRS
jgi:hypothetical protein